MAVDIELTAVSSYRDERGLFRGTTQVYCNLAF